MKAIILARVSSKEQEDNNSIPAQTRRLNEYAVRLGLDTATTYQLVESSTKANRSKFTEIINSIKRSKETIALVTDTIDRLQRDFKESVILDELRRAGKIELHFMREGLVISQNSNSSDIMRWDMGVMFAKNYVNQLKDNVKRSQEEKIRNGEWLSKAPFGYRNIRREGRSWIEPDANADIVRDMFRLYATGTYSMKRMREIVAEKHSVEKSLSQVDKILKNPFYTGIMRIKGIEYAHRYTPLITRELFDAAQRTASRYNKQPVKYAGLPFFYRGTITCGDCGRTITPERSKGHVYYHCTQYDGKHGAKWLREEELTRQFAEAIRAIHPTQEQFNEVIEALKLSHQDQIRFKTQHKATITAELSKLEKRSTRLYDSYLDGDIDKPTYKSKSVEIQQRRNGLNQKLASLETASKDYYNNAVAVMELVRDAPLLFEKSSEPEDKRRILNILFQNLELQDERLLLKYKKPFNLMASYTDNSTWLGWRDSNPRMLEPEPSALPLGDIPIALHIVAPTTA